MGIYKIGLVFFIYFYGSNVFTMYQDVNTTEIYEPVKRICEAFGFQNSLHNNMSHEENQEDIPNSMKNMNLHQAIRLLQWSCRYVDAGLYTLIITYTAPSYHDTVWQWRNRVEPYRGFVPVHDGDPIHTSRVEYKDWFYKTEFNITLSRKELLNLKYRISLTITSGNQHLSIEITPFTKPELGTGRFNNMHFVMYEKGASSQFKIFNAELLSQNESAGLSGIYAYFDWIEETENGDFKEKSFLFERSHVSKNPIGTIENYTVTNNSVNSDIYLRNLMGGAGGILRVVNWVIWKSNGIPVQYTHHIPINGGYQSNQKTCTGADLPDMLSEVLKGTTNIIECTCVGNLAPHITSEKDRTDTSEIYDTFFRKISIGFRNQVKLILVNVTQGRVGNFTCSGVDEDGSIIKKRTFALTYGEPTVVVPNSLILTRLQNNKTLLTFKMSGIPTPKLSNCRYRNVNGSFNQEIFPDSTWMEELLDNELQVTFQVPSNFIGTIKCGIKRNDDKVLTGAPEKLIINIKKGLNGHVKIDII